MSMLTKNQSITNHIMSYIVNLDYYTYLHDTVHYNILTELQVFQLARYSIQPRKYNRGKDDTYDKETMLCFHKYLMTHPTKNIFLVSNFMYDRIVYFRQYCEEYLNNNIIMNNFNDIRNFIAKNSILNMIRIYNMHACIRYNFYQN